jgi:hypothetical protein
LAHRASRQEMIPLQGADGSCKLRFKFIPLLTLMYRGEPFHVLYSGDVV